VVPVELGDGRVEVTLDTGAHDNLILSGAAARKVGIDVDVLPKLGQAGTALGPMEVRLHEETGFRFAGFAFDPLPVLVAPRGWYNLGTGSDSAIGYDLLRHFTMRIDYAPAPLAEANRRAQDHLPRGRLRRGEADRAPTSPDWRRIPRLGVVPGARRPRTACARATPSFRPRATRRPRWRACWRTSAPAASSPSRAARET
jgi:hypothetical protein